MKFYYLVISLAFLTALASDSWGQSNQPPPSNGKDSQPIEQQTKTTQQPTATDERGTDKAPLAIKVVPAQKTEAEAAAEAHEREEKTALDGRLVLFTGLLVLVGFLQFAAIGIQAVFLWLSIRDSRKALVVTQRAFVFIKTFEATPHVNFIRVLPQWENSGSTPTKEMRNWSSWSSFVGEPAPDFSFPDIDNDGKNVLHKDGGIPIFLGPKSTLFSEIIDIPLAIIERARLGHLRIFVWGWAVYSDAFDGTAVHRTEFCNEVLVTAAKETEETVAVSLAFRLYGRHNSAN